MTASSGATWAGFTTKWYSVLFAREDVREAVLNTLLVAVTSTALSTVLGTLIGFGFVALRFPVAHAARPCW